MWVGGYLTKKKSLIETLPRASGMARRLVSNHADVRRREPRAKGGFQYRGNGQWEVSEVDKHLLNPVIHFWLLRKNQEEIKE